MSAISKDELFEMIDKYGKITYEGDDYVFIEEPYFVTYGQFGAGIRYIVQCVGPYQRRYIAYFGQVIDSGPGNIDTQEYWEKFDVLDADDYEKREKFGC